MPEHREQEAGGQRSWKLELPGAEPIWRIHNWPDDAPGSNGVEGPVIVAADESLRGLDWVHAATIEVVPKADLTRLRKRVEELLISGEAVERAAEEAFWTDDLGGHIKGRHTWDSIPEEGRENYRTMIRAALRAALSANQEDSDE